LKSIGEPRALGIHRTGLGFVVGLALAANGCASFKPTTSLLDLLKAQQPTVKGSNTNLEISVEEFASAEKSRKAFDTDLTPHGVLPLLLRLDNRGPSEFLITEKDVAAYLNGQALPQIPGIDVARQAAAREAAGRATAWTLATGPFALIFWPVTISVSALHTKDVNQSIDHHFQNFDMGRVLVKPNQITGGFYFFGLPAGARVLDKLVLEVQAKEEGNSTPLKFTLAFPRLELSSTVSSPIVLVPEKLNP
jgi:hypothetical protein